MGNLAIRQYEPVPRQDYRLWIAECGMRSAGWGLKNLAHAKIAKIAKKSELILRDPERPGTRNRVDRVFLCVLCVFA